MKRLLLVLVGAAALVVLVVLASRQRASALPEPGSEAYEQVSRAFYHGLAALEVGLLDDARTQFTRATELVPEEPASWANLAVAQLRLGELDAAADPVMRALALAPDHAPLLLLSARAEIARGRLDEGIAQLRRAVDQEPQGLRMRFALAEEIERAAGPDADAEALGLLDRLVALVPDNAVVLLERARLAAKANDAGRLSDSIARLTMRAAAWPAAVQEQFAALRQAAASSDSASAVRATILMRNLLTAVPSFREELADVRTPTELVAEPLDRFVRLMPPPATPSAPDMALSFEAEPIGGVLVDPEIVFGVPLGEGTAVDLLAAYRTLRRVGGEEIVPLPQLAGAMPSSASVAAVDWNNDFRTDLAVASGDALGLWVRQENGVVAPGRSMPCTCTSVWAADVEMDGDLDLVVGRRGPEGLLVLRNSGDGEWIASDGFPGVEGASQFAWADLDGDADPDAAFVDRTGQVKVFANRQAGDFVPIPVPASDRGAGPMVVADIDADGSFDILSMDAGGVIRRMTWRGSEWEVAEIAAWQSPEPPRAGRLIVADLDNNGALDLIASGDFESRIWLGDASHALVGLQATPEGEIFAVADRNRDGRLDLVARAGAPPVGRQGDAANPFSPRWQIVQHLNRGTADYHWKVIQPRATMTTGDQRINSFGVGGDIQVRSGLLVQKQLLTGGPAHIGLGERSAIDVARIVWPNGVAQAEFGVDVDNEFVAEQRLKGSCPWVFAWDGTKMAFVTDFLWRSPLGLRINAQDTAGVVQTEDWVKIAGSQLAPKDGVYDVRITAELWETHFFDHVSLMVVDHPGDTDVFVDERFSAVRPPAYTVHVTRNIRPVTQALDHRGRDVTDLVARRDARYLATFARGRYQGIAEEHHVEFPRPTNGGLTLIASGWIYPTDSSINVAIAQGGKVQPRGLALEAQDANGRWRVVEGDLGFPAGKNKTLVIDLTRAGDARRLRLRTNLEIYWDSLAYADAVELPIESARLNPAAAELRHRGFSETSSLRAESPETPDYGRIATRSPRWRDLEGYHTRFGDVRELLDIVDDRYVIMNAGDELRLRFPERPAARAGWRRDFVLIGDGWEKDGDYNTGFSQTVLPLPSHDKPAYGAGVTSLALEDDPIYRRHREDWETYHTRFVTPAPFVNGLRFR